MSLSLNDCIADIPQNGLSCSCCETQMNPMAEGSCCEKCQEYMCDECTHKTEEGDLCNVCKEG